MWPFRKKRKSQASLPATLQAGTRVPVVLRARYDAAQTTADNARHWAMADALSADSAMSADVRRKLRQNARYEVANNSYAKGIVLTLTNDCIGTGPRLQMLSGDVKLNRLVEEAFADWCRAVRLAGKLRTMRAAKATDGETFAVLTANPLIDSPVVLDVQLVEADRVAAPWLASGNAADIDGITLDGWGNPRSYSILQQHPGDLANWRHEFDLVDATAVIHWFREDRPGQHRGVPEITPALPLFAQLRDYTLSVIAAADTAAEFAAVLYTDSPANGEAQALEPMDIVALERRMATVLPDGWRLSQVEAQQPVTGYGEFKHEILNEIARCLNMPFNVAAGNSAGYNYSSGRLDHQTYYKSIRVEQAHLAEVVLDRILAAWLYEASLTPEFAVLRGLRGVPHQWFFDGAEHVDPAKEATAQATRLTSNTTTLAIEYARQGRDWETELRQRAKEKSLMKELGLVEEPAPTDEDDEEEETDADVEARRAA
ncbi:MAG: phage portal protein [Phycisphaerae bacterium]|nr:phage portal protein [Phycisphaerae bacterium]